MSTNPFRRSSLKNSLPTTSAPATTFTRKTPDQNGLHIDTSSLSSHPASRHVSFASPPVDASIDPISYPSSPESVRSPQPTRALPAVLSYVDYESTPAAAPTTFRTFSFGANTGLDAQALDGTPELTGPLADSEIPPELERSKVDHGKQKADGATNTQPDDHPAIKETTESALTFTPLSGAIDVDAFARLLLTGTRTTAKATATTTSATTSTPPPPAPTTRRGSRMKPIITSTSSPNSSRRSSYDPTAQLQIIETTDRSRSSIDSSSVPPQVLKTIEPETGPTSTRLKTSQSAPPVPPPRRRRASSRTSDGVSDSHGRGP